MYEVYIVSACTHLLTVKSVLRNSTGTIILLCLPVQDGFFFCVAFKLTAVKDGLFESQSQPFYSLLISDERGDWIQARILFANLGILHVKLLNNPKKAGKMVMLFEYLCYYAGQATALFESIVLFYQLLNNNVS